MTAARIIGWTLGILLLVCSPEILAQKTKAQLQKEKKESLNKIKEVEKILGETTAKKKNTLGELTALNQRIREQENLINSIKAEIAFLDEEIQENNEFIQALEDDLKKLKTEYATMLFVAQKANNSATRLTFLFSADSFEQLMMRLRYMRQYSDRRKLQVEVITQVQEELSGQIKLIEARKVEKNSLLNDQISENNNLADLKKKQNDVFRSLSREEKTLKKDLEETRKALAVLDKKINEIIREEMARAEREARGGSASVVLSSSFEQNKSKFGWPVSGFISQRFGRQKHPVLPNVTIQNEGVNIQTKQNEKVKSIFEGEVRAVAFIPPLGSSVIISHGDYFTVYAGLREVYVKRGQKVTTNQEIGQVLSNADGISELRFQVRKNTMALDPQQWLKN
jgi:septal ring factor EnvC (AmiA/AmiB activator)